MDNKVRFYKYQGAGNDFVVLDNRGGEYGNLSTERIASICERRFGVGADGLLLLSSPLGCEAFRMEYYNQDGSRASFCGNGARCLCSFAVLCGVVPSNRQFEFSADDGLHTAKVDDCKNWVELGMKPVEAVRVLPDGACVLNTGVPHYVQFVDDVEDVDIMRVAPSIRYSDAFKPDGVNVNFAQITSPSHVAVRTYERGVEAETLACGTGVTAAALSASLTTGSRCISISAKGGDLTVTFEPDGNGGFSNIVLSGPAVRVFDGYLAL